MALVKVKPTSPGRRSLVKLVNADLHKGAPHSALLEKKHSKAGRNNHGHITVRHQGGGHKQHYRVVDFRRNKDGIVAKVERLEYDPNRTANLALLCYADGERRYIIAPKGVGVGAVDQRTGSAHQTGQYSTDPQYPGWYNHSLYRDAAWQRRANRACRRYFGAADGP